MSLKAVYTQGKVVTGITHGEAFSKLSDEEKQGNDFLIGNYEESTGYFRGDGKIFFAKKIILIRHATPSTTYDIHPDPELSEFGKDQAQTLGNYFSKQNTKWSNYSFISSPMRRCIQTSIIVCNKLNVNYSVNKMIQERYEDESQNSIEERIHNLISILPNESALISHCHFICCISEMIGKRPVSPNKIPTASVTVIDKDKITYLGQI